MISINDYLESEIGKFRDKLETRDALEPKKSRDSAEIQVRETTINTTMLPRPPQHAPRFFDEPVGGGSIPGVCCLYRFDTFYPDLPAEVEVWHSGSFLVLLTYYPAFQGYFDTPDFSGNWSLSPDDSPGLAEHWFLIWRLSRVHIPPGQGKNECLIGSYESVEVRDRFLDTYTMQGAAGVGHYTSTDTPLRRAPAFAIGTLPANSICVYASGADGDATHIVLFYGAIDSGGIAAKWNSGFWNGTSIVDIRQNSGNQSSPDGGYGIDTVS